MTNQHNQTPISLKHLLFLAIFLVIAGCTASSPSAVTNAAVEGAAQEILANVEEGRVDQALIALGKSGSAVTRELIFASLGPQMTSQTSSEAGRTRLLDNARQAGEALWLEATQAAQKELDDRPLYWRRLLEKREFRKQCGDTALCEQALHVFERASRGATDLTFTASADIRILISGFDPFGLDNHIDQSNPSGVAALALDGQLLTANGKTAEVQTVLFPVRFADFDDGMVEEIFEPFVRDPADNQTPDLLITISMGRTDFDLERFPGRRRSAQAPDNLRVKTGASSTTPLVPLLDGQPLNGPEFVEFLLPAARMMSTQAPYRVNDNRAIATLENGRFSAGSLAQLAGQTAVSGSGGGYLSNEISYRTVRLVQQHSVDIAVGHIHTPQIAAFDQPAITAINTQIQAILHDVVRTTP